jgi:peptide/nickel transport system ATP-binding protein
MNPDLILADEAVSALDVSLRVEMMDLMLGLQDFIETSFLFISHDISNARYLAEKSDGRIGVMYLGEIVEIGSAEDIIENPQHPYTKALLWATPDISTIQHDHTPPLREIEVADAANQPDGCRFHPRCPEAREHCTGQNPELLSVGAGHQASCYLAADDSKYHQSEALPDDADFETAEQAGD